MKIVFTFLTEKKNLFWSNKKFVYLIFINKLLWYHPKITYENILQKDRKEFYKNKITILDRILVNRWFSVLPSLNLFSNYIFIAGWHTSLLMITKVLFKHTNGKMSWIDYSFSVALFCHMIRGNRIFFSYCFALSQPQTGVTEKT